MSFSAPTGLQAYRLYQLAWNCVDWVYPPRCGGCNQPGSRWCVNCQEKTQMIAPPCCSSCGRSWSKPGKCSQCVNFPPDYTALRSLTEYGGAIRRAIVRLKYAGDLGLADDLSRYLIDGFRQQDWQVDLLVPVPASQKRLRKRGYNQAAILAWPCAIHLELPMVGKALRKVVETRSQVGLTTNQRLDNLRDAFVANPALVAGKDVLLLDDVTTSGATIRECSKALRQAGARQIYGLTLARATLEAHQHSDFAILNENSRIPHEGLGV